MSTTTQDAPSAPPAPPTPARLKSLSGGRVLRDRLATVYVWVAFGLALIRRQAQVQGKVARLFLGRHMAHPQRTGQ